MNTKAFCYCCGNFKIVSRTTSDGNNLCKKCDKGLHLIGPRCLDTKKGFRP